MGKLILTFLGAITLAFTLRSPENIEAALANMGLSPMSAFLILGVSGLIWLLRGTRTPNGGR